MEIFHGHRALFRPLSAPAIALGNFDGVHLGHQRLLELTVEAARRLGGDAVVYTFEPHPAKVLAPHLAPRLITTRERKLELIAEAGIDVCILEPFDRDLASMSPREFLDRIIRDTLGARHLVVGFDFSYGAKRAGSTKSLRAYGEEHGIGVDVVDPVTVDGLVVSSTRVRNFVSEGNMEGARFLLGRDFEVEGTVVRGAGRGRQIGVPTANIRPDTELLPRTGIYACRVLDLDSGARYGGAASLGTNPTFESGNELSLEVYLLDFDDDLYGKRLRVSFVERLRGEERYESVDELVAQINIDIARTREILDRARAG